MSGEVPEAWLALVKSPDAVHVRELWAPASEVLPRFVDYLSRSILDAKIGVCGTGHILVYQLKDWDENRINGYEDGFMMAGKPTPPSCIDRFEGEMGEIPRSLRTLWELHGFVRLKSDEFLKSVDPAQQLFSHTPELLPAKEDRWQAGRRLECLVIVESTYDLMTCLTRQPGTRRWDDLLVSAEYWGNTMRETQYRGIDDLLADWSFRSWE
ncbi:MAG TPA: hypothetical protein VFZ09_03430 [Archangium sp.]|uniref:hypothetical protein n=1 Tax=Archangium sp. TaxID=1872627 RepID=UPI002E2FC316|nr:hypothetical protein [Archangium sp.]HEX5745268.1 hypothetical protein [Archangium sp.]